MRDGMLSLGGHDPAPGLSGGQQWRDMRGCDSDLEVDDPLDLECGEIQTVFAWQFDVQVDRTYEGPELHGPLYLRVWRSVRTRYEK